MTPQGKPEVLRAISLAALGFILGTLGISLYAGFFSVERAWGRLLTAALGKKDMIKTADACTIEKSPTNHDDQIYFISCGGIY